MPGSILKLFFQSFLDLNKEFYYQLGFLIFSFVISLLAFYFLKNSIRSKVLTNSKANKILRNRNIFLVNWLLVIGFLYPGFFVCFSTSTAVISFFSITLATALTIRISKVLFKRGIYLLITSLTLLGCLLVLTGFYTPLLNFLNRFDIKIGVINTSLLKLIQSIGLISFLTWMAVAISNKVDSKLTQSNQLNKSTKLLFSKLFRVAFVTFSIFLGMSLVGLDLSIITFFAGALGVAIGLGLQNILSNIFCGIILLFDKSIRPGDVVTLADVGAYGVVHKLNARYISIRTREGIEHLIPNEEFVNKKTENLTHSDPFIRVSTTFFVDLDSDIELIEQILIDIALEIKRIIAVPAPNVRVYSLNSYAIEVRLRFWIADPENGFSSVKSEVYRAALKKFKENQIRMPHPPMNIFLNSSGFTQDLKNKDVEAVVD